MKSRQNFAKIFLTVLVAFFLVCMIANPAKFISKSLDGLSAWANAVLPSVLPFMFFTKVLSSLEQMEKVTRPFSKVSTALFKAPPISIYAFVMAILSGYPVGSKMVADLYLQGQISREDAFKMTSFCSTSGPMFIVGAVGIGMFHNSRIGYILFLSHVFGAILNGIAWHNFKLKKENAPTKMLANEAKNSCREQNSLHDFRLKKESNSTETAKNTSVSQQEQNFQNKKAPIDLSEIVLNSTLSILSVGCIITIFFIVIECFSPIFSLLPTPIAYFLEGVIEITKGCLDISTLSNTFLATMLCSFVISFGGISTILQSLTMLNSVKMPVKIFVLQKFTHACFATLATLLFLFF